MKFLNYCWYLQVATHKKAVIFILEIHMQAPVDLVLTVIFAFKCRTV